MDWPEAIEQLAVSIVKIATPRGSGTGCIISCSKESQLFGIATAAHVVNQAHYWDELIRIEHPATNQSIVLSHTQRSIILAEHRDTAVIVFAGDHKLLPNYNLPLVPEQMNLKVGCEVGWLGFPVVSPNNLCFFTGRVSCWIESHHAYLIDGVSINGVSGGPVFHLGEKFPVITGVVSAYLPNRLAGDSLPGLSVVRDVEQFHDIAKRFASLDDAKKHESAPEAPPESDKKQ
jgi:hypothetical protein